MRIAYIGAEMVCAICEQGGKVTEAVVLNPFTVRIDHMGTELKSDLTVYIGLCEDCVGKEQEFTIGMSRAVDHETN